MFNVLKSLTLTWWQAGAFKLTLVSVGALLAVYFPKFFKKYTFLWWLIAVVGTIYLLFVWYPQ